MIHDFLLRTVLFGIIFALADRFSGGPYLQYLKDHYGFHGRPIYYAALFVLVALGLMNPWWALIGVGWTIWRLPGWTLLGVGQAPTTLKGAGVQFLRHLYILVVIPLTLPLHLPLLMSVAFMVMFTAMAAGLAYFLGADNSKVGPLERNTFVELARGFMFGVLASMMLGG